MIETLLTVVGWGIPSKEATAKLVAKGPITLCHYFTAPAVSVFSGTVRVAEQVANWAATHPSLHGEQRVILEGKSALPLTLPAAVTAGCAYKTYLSFQESGAKCKAYWCKGSGESSTVRSLQGPPEWGPVPQEGVSGYDCVSEMFRTAIWAGATYFLALGTLELAQEISQELPQTK